MFSITSLKHPGPGTRFSACLAESVECQCSANFRIDFYKPCESNLLSRFKVTETKPSSQIRICQHSVPAQARADVSVTLHREPLGS